ncbi:Testosterone 17-beta-dehydrogenase 3 [Merluccius polli]|uniref:Testosterone 17-beta-dehydrogenase 3 n=1 Tax=Merluccius polli TaxID=89951 RepID=A0AA47NQU1_MERPO|nr:Testosterone 17-beta-dehydrogenase 3 [Merluccius polli]
MKGSQKLLKAQMDKAEDLVLVQPTLLFKDLVWICFSSPMILPVPLYGLNPQEVDVHLSHSVGHLCSTLGCCEEVLHNCSRDPTEDGDVTHDVEASRFLDMGDDFPGQRLISESLPEVLLLLWVGEPSHLCHHANTLSRDLIGCRRACGYPDASGGKQVAPDEVCQQHVHRGRRCDISPDPVVLEVQRKSTLIQTIQDEDNLEPSHVVQDGVEGVLCDSCGRGVSSSQLLCKPDAVGVPLHLDLLGSAVGWRHASQKAVLQHLAQCTYCTTCRAFIIVCRTLTRFVAPATVLAVQSRFSPGPVSVGGAERMNKQRHHVEKRLGEYSLLIGCRGVDSQQSPNSRGQQPLEIMEFTDFCIFLGTAAVLHYGVRLLWFARMLYPKVFFPLPKSFLQSMGEWAVVTGGSDGIGRAYAFELARQGMDVMILSRSKKKLELTAEEIAAETGRRVRVVVADFTQDGVCGEVEDHLKDLEVGVLGEKVLMGDKRDNTFIITPDTALNNVGSLPTMIPGRFLDTTNIDQTITNVINCNIKTMAQMCRICLPGMEKRGKGVILSLSSGMATIPSPLYSLYSASKASTMFVEMFSLSLQAEYRDKGIIIQSVSPFGVSTSMTGFSKVGLMMLRPEDFVRTSLQYLKAGDKTNGSVVHTIMVRHVAVVEALTGAPASPPGVHGWFLRIIPNRILHSEVLLQGFIDFVQKKLGGR